MSQQEEKKKITKRCDACGATIELTEYIPSRLDQRGYWTGKCACGCSTPLQVVDVRE
jgi:hypothetical protein